MFRSLRPAQLIVDISLASLCLLLRLPFGFEHPALVIVVLLMAGALAIRRLSPGLALGIAWVGALLQLAAQQAPDVANLAILAVLFTTARYANPRVKWAGLVSAGVGSLLAAAYLAYGPLSLLAVNGASVLQTGVVFAVWLVSLLALLGLSWTLGLLAKTWSEAREAKTARTLAQQKVVVEQERNRIARDMHDVVAHSLAVVIAQADGARYAHKSDPDAVDAALVAIASTAREALSDVRGLLGQLRHSQAPGPQPEVSDLARLVDQLRASGLDVHFEQIGEVNSLTAPQQLAIYRISQEALTNALRHGNAAHPVTLRLDWQADAVTLHVENHTRGGEQPTNRVGHGLTGMRERASLVGGSFTSARTESVYSVTARVPLSEEAAV